MPDLPKKSIFGYIVIEVYSTIYVDPTSRKALELGTKEYPYKTLVSSLIEIFNYLTPSSSSITIKIREGTVDFFNTMFTQNIILEQNNLTIRTYTVENEDNLGLQTTIFIKTDSVYQYFLSTRFAIIYNEIYNTQKLLNSNTISETELYLTNTASTFFIIRSNLTIENLKFQNKFSSSNSKFQLMFAWSIQQRTITFNVKLLPKRVQYVTFSVYGRVFQSITPLNFNMINSVLQTDWINEGIIIQTDCTLDQTSVLKGDIIFRNYTQRGERYLQISQPIVSIQTINNITFDGCYLSSFARKGDVAIHQIQTQSTSKCVVKANDGVVTNYIFTNNYITMTTHEKNIYIVYNIIMNRLGNSQRPYYISIENITLEHIYSYRTFLSFSSTLSYNVTNITFRNASQPNEQQNGMICSATPVSGTVYAKNLGFYDTVAYQKSLFVFARQQNLYVSGVIIKNVTLDPTQNNQVMFKHAGGLPNSELVFKNFYFSDNKLYQNQAIYLDSAVKSFKLINSRFEHEQISSASCYIPIYTSHYLFLNNLTFNNITYQDSSQISTHALRIDQQILQTGYQQDSQISNVVFTNSNINFIKISGFKSNGTLPTESYFLILDNISIQNNTITKSENLIHITPFTYSGNVQIIMTNSLIRDNMFIAGGNILQAQHNLLKDFFIKDVNFVNNTRGLFLLDAGNLDNLDIPLAVSLKSCNFSNNLPIISSLFTVQTNSILNVYNTTFSNTTSLSRGSIFMADYQKVAINVFNSTFISNQAFSGGVFYSHYSSAVNFQNCLFTNNFAIQGGIGVVEDEGYFSIQDSTAYNNSAFSSSLFHMINVIDFYSLISNTYFEDNNSTTIENIDSVAQQFQLNKIFFENIQQKLDQISKRQANSKQTTIGLSKAKLIINNGTVFNSERNLINAYIATLQISNTTFTNIDVFYNDSSFLEFTQSEVNITKTTFSNINALFKQNTSTYYLIMVALKTEIGIDKCDFTNSSVALLRGSIFSKCKSKCDQKYIHWKQGFIRRFYLSYLFCMQIVLNKLFIEHNCNYTIRNSYFSNNVAKVSGGCIKYNKNRPITANNTFDNSNYAPYGNIYGGYPYTIKIQTYDKLEIASGQIYEGKIEVSVLDPDLIIVNTDQQRQNVNLKLFSTLKIASLQENSEVGGIYQVQVQNGIGKFQDLKLIAEPGSKNVPFKIFSQNIDSDSIKEIFSLDSSVIVNQEVIYFDFRYCVSGEIVYNNEQILYNNPCLRCIKCSYGSYSTGSNSTTCKDCPANAECPGGDVLDLKPGYWRSSSNSIYIIECIEEAACIGGTGIFNSSSQSLVTTADFPLCAIGYGGNLCEQCQIVNGTRYTRIGLTQCGLCPSKLMNILKLIGIMVGILFALIILIYVNLRSKKESEASVTLRIMTNYIQIMTSAAAYNLQWPVYLQEFFGVFSSVGEVAESSVSIDCFLYEEGFDSDTGPSFVFMKTLLVGILPIILIICFGITYILFFLKFGVDYQNWIRQMIVSSLVVIYALLPTIQKFSLNLYFCMEIDPDEYWLFTDLQIMCWTKNHLTWALAVGTPMIAIWVIGFPLILFTYLKRNQTRLEDDEFFSKFRLIYQGLKHKFFYWEFVNMFRKTFLVSTIVFLQIYPSMFKALLSILLLSVFLRLQIVIQPYKNPVINELESREVMSSLITFLGGLFFVNQEYINETIKLIAFIVIVLFNLWFLIMWVYCFIKQFRYPKLQRITKLFRKMSLSYSLSKQEVLFESMSQEYQTQDGSQVFNSSQIQKSQSLKVTSDKRVSLDQSLVALKPKSDNKLGILMSKKKNSISNITKKQTQDISNQINEITEDMSFFQSENKTKRGLLQSNKKLNIKILTGQIKSKDINIEKVELQVKRKQNHFEDTFKKDLLGPKHEEELKTEDFYDVEEEKSNEREPRGNIAQPFEILDSIDQALPEGISILEMKKQFIKSRQIKGQSGEIEFESPEHKKKRRRKIQNFRDLSIYSVKNVIQKKNAAKLENQTKR